jgi:hypothetical protein
MIRIKIFLIGLLIVIVVGALLFYFVFPRRDEGVFYKVIPIESGNHSVIFIKKKIWGMTSDHQVIVISNTKEKRFTPNAKQNYIYNGLSPLFYNLKNDSLYIYTYKASPVPQELVTDIKIVQIELENPEMMQLLEKDRYKSQGLKIID